MSQDGGFQEKHKDKWCPYPWFNLNSNTDGSVKLCCSIYENFHLKDEIKIFNFGTDPIEKIWNSANLKNIRQEFDQNKKTKICSVCWNLEDKNLDSSRISALQQQLHARSEPPMLLPTSLELRLGNKCNLKCLSCWSMSSSTVSDERVKLLNVEKVPEWLKAEWNTEINNIKKLNLNWYESPVFKESIEKMAPGLRRLYLTGGEPTLIKENLEILKTLLKHDNKSCAISFTTNLTLWNEEFYESLKSFDDVEIQISLDGFEKLNEFIRFPSNWSAIERNIDKILEKLPKAHIKIYSVYSLLNCLWIDELMEFLFYKFKKRNAIWTPILLQAPLYLSADLAPIRIKEEAQKKIFKFLSKHGERDTKLWFEYGLGLVVAFLEKSNSDEKTKEVLLKKAKDYILLHSQSRKSFHPCEQELFEALT